MGLLTWDCFTKKQRRKCFPRCRTCVNGYDEGSYPLFRHLDEAVSRPAQGREGPPRVPFDFTYALPLHSTNAFHSPKGQDVLECIRLQAGAWVWLEHSMWGALTLKVA